MGYVSGLRNQGDPTLIGDSQAPRANGESFSGGVHEAVFDLEQAVWIPDDFHTFLPAKLLVFFSGQSASFFWKEFERNPIVVESVALLVFGCGPKSVPTVDHPLLSSGLSHLLLIFKEYVRSVDRAKAKNAGANLQWGDQFPFFSSDPNGFCPTPVGNQI